MTSASEKLAALTELYAGFSGWDKSTEELVALVRESAREIVEDRQRRADDMQAVLDFWKGLPWWQRWLHERPMAPAPVPTEADIVAAWAGRFERFASWMHQKRMYSGFYADSFEKEIPACEALVAALRK